MNGKTNKRGTEVIRILVRLNLKESRWKYNQTLNLFSFYLLHYENSSHVHSRTGAISTESAALSNKIRQENNPKSSEELTLSPRKTPPANPTELKTTWIRSETRPPTRANISKQTHSPQEPISPIHLTFNRVNCNQDSLIRFPHFKKIYTLTHTRACHVPKCKQCFHCPFRTGRPVFRERDRTSSRKIRGIWLALFAVSWTCPRAEVGDQRSSGFVRTRGRERHTWSM